MDETLLDLTFVDLLQRTAGYGGFRQSTMETLIGLNSHGYGGIVPHNDDFVGLSLFTRPRLNLSYNNLSANRVMSPLLTGEKATYQTYIRNMLDPVGVERNPDRVCPFFDPKQAFIPLLSNTLLSLSGWPDTVVGTYTSTQGVYREEWSMVDDVSKIYNAFDISANFRNIQGDPISALFTQWVHYMSGVYEGIMLPHEDCIQENEKDYETAIYRLIMSPDWEYVHKIGRTIGMPTNVPNGTAFNYDHDRPRVSDMDQITINFRCQGAEYNDPILIDEFNWVVQEFNPYMRAVTRTSDGTFKDPTGRLLRIGKEDRKFLNYYGYPMIDPMTGRISWFIEKGVYAQLSGQASNAYAGIGPAQ